MKIFTGLVFIGILLAQGASADDPISKLSLKGAESRALRASFGAKAIGAEMTSLQHKIKAQQALQYPRISVEGSYRYVSEIPTLSFPGGASMAFGDNRNYSFGPVLNWTLWDSGAVQNSIKGAEAQVKAKESEKQLTHRQIVLSSRLAYFRVQLRLEQKQMIADSLKLAESQHRDIANRVRAGASNRIDLLSAHKEVLNLKIQARQVEADLNGDMRDLYSLIGKGDIVDTPAGLELETIASCLVSLSKFENVSIDARSLEQHPLIRMQTASADSTRFLADSLRAGRLPKVALYAKSSLDYPNGPILDEINQNMVGLTLSMPIFEGGRSANKSAEKLKLVMAIENRREQARSEMIRDIHKANRQLRGLKQKIEFYKRLVSESEERAKLVYSAYRLGRSSFLEVQSANLQALDAKAQSATNEVQILFQLAYLASVSEEQ